MQTPPLAVTRPLRLRSELPRGHREPGSLVSPPQLRPHTASCAGRGTPGGVRADASHLIPSALRSKIIYFSKPCCLARERGGPAMGGRQKQTRTPEKGSSPTRRRQPVSPRHSLPLQQPHELDDVPGEQLRLLQGSEVAPTGHVGVGDELWVLDLQPLFWGVQ